MKTLENFLKKHRTSKDIFDFAKNLTLEQFLETCPRGDWILWLFNKTNPKSIKKQTLVAGHCANTVRHLLWSKQSMDAIDAAIAFGKGKATKDDLVVFEDLAQRAVQDACKREVWVANQDCAIACVVARDSCAVARFSEYAAHVANCASIACDAAAKKQNQKLTADICRKYLPLKIWNQSKI